MKGVKMRGFTEKTRADDALMMVWSGESTAMMMSNIHVPLDAISFWPTCMIRLSWSS